MDPQKNISYGMISVFLWTLLLVSQATSQVFIYNCNDAEIAQPHIDRNQHTYCSHACRYAPNPADLQTYITQLSICSPTGACLCVQPCYNGTVAPAPNQIPRNDICPIVPAPTIDPENPESAAACIASCQMQCPGGFGGIQCTEARNAPLLVPRTRICTCVCPAQPCVTPTIPPTTIVPIPVPVPIPSLLPFKTLLLFLKKAFIACWILFKLFALKIFLFICWRALLGHYIDLDDIKIFLRWFIRYYF